MHTLLWLTRAAGIAAVFAALGYASEGAGDRTLAAAGIAVGALAIEVARRAWGR